MGGEADVRQLSVAVVGANYPNADGGNRRSEIAFCDPGEPLTLTPEPKNEHDEHAIAVYSARSFQIGYVASQRAVYLKKLMRDGHTVEAIFHDVAPAGAIARVGIDCTPTLPPPPRYDDEEPESDALEGPPAYEDIPDPIWPDD